MLTNRDYKKITQDTDHPLHFLWYAVTSNLEGNPLATNENTFQERKEDFLVALGRLLSDGSIKLHRKGVFWEAPIDHQLRAFSDAWPTSELNSGYSDFYWWFLDAACPAGVAWKRLDGSYVIAE